MKFLVLRTSLGFSPFARHYLGNHLFVFFSSPYLDVSVQTVPSCAIMNSHVGAYASRRNIKFPISNFQCPIIIRNLTFEIGNYLKFLCEAQAGFPIRKLPDQSLTAAHRYLSQPSTSFFGVLHQGIH